MRSTARIQKNKTKHCSGYNGFLNSSPHIEQLDQVPISPPFLTESWIDTREQGARWRLWRTWNTDIKWPLTHFQIDKQFAHHKRTTATILLSDQENMRPFKMSNETSLSKSALFYWFKPGSSFNHHAQIMGSLHIGYKKKKVFLNNL